MILTTMNNIIINKLSYSPQHARICLIVSEPAVQDNLDSKFILLLNVWTCHILLYH